MKETTRKEVDKIWETFYTCGILDSTKILVQSSYLFCLRVLDYRQMDIEENTNINTEKVDVIFKDSQKHLRWSDLKKQNAGELFEIVSNEVYPFINNKFKNMDLSFSDQYESEELLVPTPQLLQKIFNAIDNIDLHKHSEQSELYEYLLSKFFSDGRYGQLSTPRHIVDMMIQLTLPSENDTIIDPAVGTAGFLVAAENYLKQSSASSLQGYDINRSMLLIATMNLFFHRIEYVNLVNVDTLGKEYTRGEKYSLILSNPPFIGKNDYVEISSDLLELTRTNRTELLFLISIIRMLDNNGRCAIIVPDGVLFGNSKAHKAIKKEIVENYNLDAIISLPSGVFLPYTGVSTSIIMLSNIDIKRTDKVWFYDMKADGYSLNNKRTPIEENDIPDIIHRYHTRLETELNRERTSQSFFVSKEEIVANDYNLTLNKYKEVELEKMDYNDYTGITFEDLIKQINNGRSEKNFVEVPNSIYIPKLGTSNPVCNISELVIKEQNYFQVVLKDIVLNDYLAAMFKSVLGQSLLTSATSVGVIPKINKSNLIQITVPVPDMNVQRQIVGTIDKINKLKDAIDKFDNELALNPVSSIKVLDRLDQFIEILGELTDADYIKNIIRKGESKVVEFKETFGYDVRKDKKEKYIETSALKTIIGFLNTDGGVLLIGVNDEGIITGVDHEINKFHKNNDKYLLNFKNRIKTRIGEEYYPLINYRLSSTDGKNVLIVECKESDKPCYLDGSDFYVRTNPATDQLTGPKLVEYVRKHFK